MKNLKIALTLATLTGMLAFSACSSNRTKTTEAETVTPVQTEPVVAAVPSPPTYTVANLGASTAGRSR